MSDHSVNPADDFNESPQQDFQSTALPHQLNEPAGFDSSELNEIAAQFATTTYSVSTVEPIRRDVERALRDLLGQSPDESGNWVSVHRSQNGEFSIRFNTQDPQVWFRLATALHKINEVVSLREIQKSLPKYRHARATTAPDGSLAPKPKSVHLVARYGGGFKKGRK
jgi:hypothetical protein